jgi:hypothetical protein
MKAIFKHADSINSAIESKRMDRDKKKGALICGDKYAVKVKDDKGKEYKIEYL